MDLADFIDTERASIIGEWETFARSMPEGIAMSSEDLRDHADEILSAVVHDMRSAQTLDEQAEKSKGRGLAPKVREISQLHAVLRIGFGFSLGQVVAEYRALRASVLRLWEEKELDPRGVTRFNEAIDEALTEAVDRFTITTTHFRDQSLGILGHDLRNPLFGIATNASVLMASEELSDRNARVAARILSSANRMGRMIGDLLDLTRTRFGDPIPVRPGPVDLDPLCRQVIAELEGTRPGGELVFAGEGDLRGEWDGDRIAQVVSNLVGNAISYGSTSEPIRVVARDEGTEVVLTVHNAGPPIPMPAQKTIFDPMARHVGNDHRVKGLGLGLYIASQIVLAHGGKLDVTSSETAGTVFRVRLPRHTGQPLGAAAIA